MKRSKWKYLLGMALVLSFAACTREAAMPERAPQSVEGKKVQIEFSVSGPAKTSATKVLDNGGDISWMYVAVFGSSGYLKEYSLASLKGETTIYRETGIIDEETGEPVLIPYTLYTFSVGLTITDSPRKVHFLGNGPSYMPFGYDTAVMPIQMSQLNDQEQEKAYWQMIELPEGIQARRDGQGNFIDKDGDRYLDDDGNENPDFDGFILDPGQAHYFQEIPLIRNWAKIVLYTEPGSHFTPISFAVINFPSCGAVAPYSGKTGFIHNYQDLDFFELQEMGYTANLPAGTKFDDSKPDKSAFEIGTYNRQTGELIYEKMPDDGARVAAALQSKAQVEAGEDTEGHAVYLYERPVPSEKIPPTYVIVYGHYYYPPSGEDENDPDYDPGDPDNEGDYFYKVDLMETFRHESGEWESGYYPIYRNFKYQINITKILSMGHKDPASAAASAGSADVSADISTGHISDISDGVGRLHLTWMSQTYQSENGPEHPVEDLKVFFSTTNGEVISGEDAVTAQLLPPTDGGPDIIYNLSVGAVSTESDAGWRPIQFCTVAPGKTIRSQTIRITGSHQEGRLYRDVVITVLPTQDMLVRCAYPVLHTQKGAEQSVIISIPEGLAKSMFPIEFEIEPQDHTLTPDPNFDDNNLPVVISESISDQDGYAGKPSYHFTRTLTWDQYKAAEITRTADGVDKTWRTFTCHFKSNCAKSATTVWVKSKYFETKKASFENYGFGLIHDACIPKPVPAESEQSIQFDFQIEKDEDGKFPEMTLRLVCLDNDTENNPASLIRGDDVDTYLFTPVTNKNSLHFITTTADGEFSLELSAPGYNTIVLKPYHFNKGITTRSFGLLEGVFNPMEGGDKRSFWSNVAYGKVQSTNNRGSSERGVIFGYYDDPDCPYATEVTLTDADGNKISDKTNTSGVVATTPGSYPYTPSGSVYAGGDAHYHELQLTTVAAKKDQPISLRLSSPGYMTETFHYKRLAGKTHIHTSHFASSRCSKNATTGLWTIQPTNNTDDNSSFKLEITPLENTVTHETSPEPTKESGILRLGEDKNGNVVPGSCYEIKVTSGNISGISDIDNYRKGQRFFGAFFEFEPGYMPAEWTPGENSGTCFLYPGSNRVYQWVAFDSEDEYEERFEPFAPENNPVKTIVVEVGDTAIRLVRFSYKAISNVK